MRNLRRIVVRTSPRFASRFCATTAGSAAAAATTASSSSPSQSASPSPPASWAERRHPRLLKMLSRELLEEGLRDERPPEPKIPRDWALEHFPHSAELLLRCKFRPFGSNSEELHEVFFNLETKHPEKTFKPDLGERVDPEHATFYLFITKPGAGSATKGGGIEFMLTSVDAEMVLDAMTVHSTAEDVENAKLALRSSTGATAITARRLRDGKYRGPSVNELDDALLDEILDYLDERGINNAFAEYVLSQVSFVEQLEYETFLTALQKFSQ